MTTFISLLRGINVSGQKSIRMAEISHLYEALGLNLVQTYLQSGNIVFQSDGLDGSALVNRIEAKIEKSYGYHVAVFIRTLNDFQHIVNYNPFLRDRNEDPANLYVTFLYSLPKKEMVNRLAAQVSEEDKFIPGEKEMYLLCLHGYGKTKLSNNYFEKRLSVSATTRNWNTVTALLKIAKA
jgi:uncharacterized protein (DUF1697 family)